MQQPAFGLGRQRAWAGRRCVGFCRRQRPTAADRGSGEAAARPPGRTALAPRMAVAVAGLAGRARGPGAGGSRRAPPPAHRACGSGSRPSHNPHAVTHWTRIYSRIRVRIASESQSTPPPSDCPAPCRTPHAARRVMSGQAGAQPSGPPDTRHCRGAGAGVTESGPSEGRRGGGLLSWEALQVTRRYRNEAIET